MQLVCTHTYICVTDSTAQRQTDTHTHAASWILLGEAYIMHSIFEWAPVTFVPASRKLCGMCTREHYIILYKFLNEIYNINCIYTMNFWILFLDVLIDPWIHLLLKSCLRAVYLMPYYLVGCGEWIWCREWILHCYFNLY